LLRDFRSPWSPAVIAGVTVLTSVLAGAVLHALNSRRLGETKTVWPLVAGSAALVVASCVYFVLVADPPRIATTFVFGLNIAAAVWFHSSQKPLFEAYRAAGGKPGAWWSAVAIGLGAIAVPLVLVMGLFVALTLVQGSAADEAFEARDDRRARELYEPMCDHGDPAACNNLGILHHHGRGGPRDDVRASSLFRRACEGGENAGCLNLADMRRLGLGDAEDPGSP
jgi:hypothetical protein